MTDNKKALIRHLLQIYGEKHFTMNEFIDLLEYVDTEHELTLWKRLFTYKDIEKFRQQNSIENILEAFFKISSTQIDTMYYLYYSYGYFHTLNDKENAIIKSIYEEIGENND